METRKTRLPKSLEASRFDLAASELFPDLSRKLVKRIIDAGGAWLNRKRVILAKTPVMAGDTLELHWDPRRIEVLALPTIESSAILFSSPDFLVVNKPAGVASQGSLDSATNTIIHAVHQLDPKEYPLEQLFLVHRLDKDTSGLLLIARNTAMRVRLEALFAERKICKTYELLSFHIPQQPEGMINFPMAPDRSRKNTWIAVMNATRKMQGQKEAVTCYQQLKSFPASDASYLCAEPKTGRTHQIRVHLAAIGCPIIGDKNYAQNVLGHPFARIAPRQMLHARRLSFQLSAHEVFVFEAPIPADFLACLKELEYGKNSVRS